MAGAGPHLDVLYHDAVKEAMGLQVSFDIFQFREGTLTSTGRLGLAGPRQKSTLFTEERKMGTFLTCILESDHLLLLRGLKATLPK